MEPKKTKRVPRPSGIRNSPSERNHEGIPTGDGCRTYIQSYRKRKQARGKRGGKKKKEAQKLLGQGIFNLSSVQFTREELKVLELGLKYAPDKPFDQFEAFIDLQKFLRKLNIKKHFAMNPGELRRVDSDFEQTRLKNNSIFNPKTPGNQCINAFKKMVEGDIKLMGNTNKKRPNNIWKTIKNIGKKHEVVIRPADKGGGLVILNKKDYLDEMNNLLSIENTYKTLKANPKKKYERKLKTYVDKGRNKGILNSKEAEYLISNSTRTPVIYHTPKIHKRLEKPPGRPIISGINSIFSRLGEYLDIFLKPLVKEGKSYLRDSMQLIQELQEIKGAEHWLLVAVDVNSLYTSIEQKDGLRGVERALHRNTRMKQEQIGYILEGLKMAMACNYFWHDRKYYVQTKGVAMGARYAPSVANLFMDLWEEQYIFSKNIPQIKMYKRYIDDVIILWNGTTDSLTKFLDNLNNNKYGITFTGKWSPDKIDYLDLEIFKTGEKLLTRTFFKPTDRNGYIPTASCHHPRWKTNVPKGQLLHIRRNCDKSEDFNTQADILIGKFQEKGYDKEKLLKLKADIMAADRSPPSPQ